MVDRPDYFTSDVLRHIEERTFVRCVEFHPELPSTNDLALQLADQADIDLPLLVLTERQTAGRGRGSNRWWAYSGALTFSLLIETATLNLPVERWPQISLTAGLAVCETLQRLLPDADVGLKWPNDVFLQGRKVCGILVEVPPKDRGKLVIGIGLNVNNSFAAAPEELRAIATSLYDVALQYFELPEVLPRVLQGLENRLASLRDGRLDLAERWQALCLLRGRPVQLDVGTRQVVGVCQGIDDEGALVLQDETGRQRYFSGVITHFE